MPYERYAFVHDEQVLGAEPKYANDIAVRLIWPVGHYRSRDPANNKKRLDEYELKGNTITIVGATLFNYTGRPTIDGSGRRLYYVVKYQYNSKFDPTQKTA